MLRPIVDTVTRRAVAPVGLASLVSTLNSLGISVLYARLAGPAQYGVFQLTLAIVGLAGIVALAGSPSSATRAAAQGRAAARGLFRARLPYAFAAAALLGAAGGVLWIVRQDALGPGLIAAAAVLPLFVGGDVYPAHLIGARRFGDFLLFQLVLQASTLLAVLAAVALAPGSPWLAVLAIGGLTGLVQLRGLVRLPPHPLDLGDLAYARRLTVLTILTTLDVRLDILLAGFLLGPRDASFVAVARTLPTLGKRIWEIVYQPLFVRIASLGEADALREARRLRWPILAVLGGFAAAGAAIAPWLIPALYGPPFRTAVHLSQLLLLATALIAAGYPEEVFFKAHGRFRELTRIYTILPLLSFAALPPLILTLGIIGIGVEALLVAVVYIALIVWLARDA